DPEVARADYPPHCEAFPVRLRRARRPNLPPPADALARLRIFEHRVLSVNLVLRLEVVRIGGGPVAIQSRSNLSVFHIKSPRPSPTMLSRRTNRRPGTGAFQMTVWTVFPRHATSRGRPMFTSSRRGIVRFSRSVAVTALVAAPYQTDDAEHGCDGKANEV